MAIYDFLCFLCVGAQVVINEVEIGVRENTCISLET